MKHARKRIVTKGSSNGKIGHWRLRLLMLICLSLVSCLIAVIVHNWAVVPAQALVIPPDYGINISEIDGLENEGSFKGILCTDKDDKKYTLSYITGGDNGLVTLARISQNNSLEGYTFTIAYDGKIPLGVNYKNEAPISEGSFFGIGSNTYPFMGTIVVGGSADTYIAFAENSWKYLFNNISNKAVIKSEGNSRLSASYIDEDSDSGSNTVSGFTFCNTLTVTKAEADGAMDLSGYSFGTGSNGKVPLVQGDGAMALFAAQVIKGDAQSFSVDLSVDLSTCFPNNSQYAVTSTNGDAGGLIGTVGAGVTATITLPSSLNFEVTSGGTQTNAGILIGSNNGNVTFKAKEEGGTLSFTGTLNATGSAGLIGANQSGSTACFENKIIIDGLDATGLRAGGIAGTGKGPITVKFAEIKNSTFKRKDSDVVGRLGGAIGSVDETVGGLTVLEKGTVELSDNTFSASQACYIGGYIGYLATSGGDVQGHVQKVTVNNTTITGSGNASDKIGGYIGYLKTSGDFRIDFGSATSILSFGNINAGICGGVIGEVDAPLKNTVQLNKGTIQCTVTNGASATVGGLVGKITSGYLKTDNISLNNRIVRANYAADLVGQLAAGSMLDVGTLSLKEANGSVLVGQTGQGSVVRLRGSIEDTSSSVISLVYQQDASLIYKDTGCTYDGKVSKNNDIGNYGQVIRNDTLGVIKFVETTHQVSIHSDPPLSGSGDISISNVADFARLAITFHTKGAISGVTDIPNADYSSLYSKTINLTDEVSLEGTGIEQLTPAIATTPAFTGKLNGGGHTLTLAIGENISGDNVGVQASANNQRSSLGLFAYLNNATVDGVNIAGTISLGLPDADQYVGSLAGKAVGTLSIQNCKITTKITVANGVAKKAKNTSLYVGGMVGYIGDVSGLSVTGCTLGASITDSTDNNATNNRLYFGGLGGYVKYTGSGDIDFTNNTIQTRITRSSAYTGLKMGGFIGELVCSNYVKADLSITTASGVKLEAASVTGSAGGILGHTFDKCHVILNGTYKGTVNVGSASLGGLLYTLNGRLTVNDGFAISGTDLTATGTLRGLLLADGKNAIVTVKSAPSGFNNETSKDFDLFVGENITAYTSVGVAATGGVVTVETGAEDGIGKLPDSKSAWYALINARSNTKTRYYFNIAELKKENDLETVRSATDLLYWHIYDYAQSLPDYVKDEFIPKEVNNITTVKADINMTGFCFYPTKKEAVTVDFQNHSLTFGRPAHVKATNQFFGLQAGLLSDVSANSATTAVCIQNIKLSGTASNLGSDLGSGALICGTVSGSQSGSNKNEVTLTLSSIVLNGITVETAVKDYRPLMVNRIGSYVTATISNITQDGYTNITQDGYTTNKAASSLIGRGGFAEGGTASSNIKVTLSQIVLDGKQSSSIFTNATLFYNVEYGIGSGSFIYNFNYEEDRGSSSPHRVTYGAELSLNEDQKQYFDRNIYVNTDSDDPVDAFDFSGYRPYVYVGSDSDKGNVLLSVNRKGADLIAGFGTYLHPYVISTNKQLEYISTLLSGNNGSFSDGWKINFPQGDWSDVSKLDLTDSYEVVVKDGDLTCGENTLTRKVLLAYLAGAYYKLGDDLTLSSTFAGIGSTTYPFHGVVHGNGKIVTMTSPNSAIGANGYGFINVANGCAVYGLTIKYGKITLSSDEFREGDTATSGPTATSLTTTLPHFGGVIAWVVGGDNLIDEVTVSAAKPYTAISVTPGASHTVCGGYVGLISGGGVLLSDVGELSLNRSDRLYHNNYIGRVLNGYAIAIDGNTYNNGKVITGLDADFFIPAIAKDMLAGHNKRFSSNTFTLEDAQDLLLFSFGMNSGAFAGNKEGYGYGETSLSRYGDYSLVGVETESDVTDGKYTDDTNKTSILLTYFGISTPTDLRNTSKGLTVKLTGTKYDMSVYGNAFRGMSGAYSSSPTYKIVFFGKDKDSGTATITLAMDMRQYAVGKKDGSNDVSYFEADSIRNYGLFGSINNTVTFQNLILKGKLSVSCINSSNAVMESNPFAKLGGDDGDGCSVGGFIGQSKGAVTFTNTSLSDLRVNSPDICGGFVGKHASGNLTVNSGCSYRNATIKGKRHTGGVAGYVNAGKVLVTDITVNDSVIETRVDMRYAGTIWYGTAGGVFGKVGSGTTSVTLENCTITKTAAVYTANYNNGGNNVASGGLVGITQKQLMAKNCTVDGCVVLAVSNFGSGSVFPDTLKPSGTNPLSDRFKNNVVYNDEKQNVANLLAWMLEQSNDKSFSVGPAGGLLGQVASGNVTLSGCTVSATAAPSVIISFNNAGGLIGEQRGGSTIAIENCQVTTQSENEAKEGYDMYIVGAPRAAGVISYSGGAYTYTLTNVQIVGTAAHPIRILGVAYSATDAAGLIGDVNKSTVTAENCKVSYCIIGGSRAAGAWSNVVAGSIISFSNIDVSHNLIYSKSSKSDYAGGLFGNTNASSTVNGAYVGENYIVGASGAGGLEGQLSGNNTLSAKYVILDNNVIRKITANSTNFTFAAQPLTGDTAANAAATALIKSSDFSNVGLIVGNNAGTVTAIAVSCSTPEDVTTQQKNFGTGAGTGTVVYTAYGAGDTYRDSTDGNKTPQQAIEAMQYAATIGSNVTPLYGDSVTAGTPTTISGLGWWMWKDENFKLGEAMKNLGDHVGTATVNSDLPLFCLSEKTNDTMMGYLNMLTGGGFGAAVDDKSVTVTVTSQRYTVAADGSLTKAEGKKGSVVFENGMFKAGVYDNLDAEEKTLTVLTVTFNDVYTMHLAIYYSRSVNIKTFVVPLEGEQYYVPSFLDAAKSGEYWKTTVSFGNPFTLYVEYNYNDMAAKLENFNFKKQIAMVNSAGQSSEDAKKMDMGTAFVLIDLNSASPAGYSYYTLVLTADAELIKFEDFQNGEGFVPVNLETIGKFSIEKRVCKDANYISTEKYMLIVYPVQNNTAKEFSYNMKAVIDEKQREETNIAVKYDKDSKVGQISVWPSPTVGHTSSTETSQFSHTDKLQMNVTTTVTFPDGYVNALQGRGGHVYGTHIIRLQDGGKDVELPMGTAVTVKAEDGTVIYSNEGLLNPTTQIRFSTGDLLNKDGVEMRYQIILDFSLVNLTDFNKAFSSKSVTLVDSFSLSDKENLTGSQSCDTSKVYTVNMSEAVRLAVVPTDNRYLGINIRNEDDVTNSGEIEFSVSANFDAFPDTTSFENATVSFSVSKKDLVDGKYVYVPLEESESSLWSVIKGDTSITKDVLEVDDKKQCEGVYLLKIDLENSNLDLTNYRFTVQLTATGSDGETVQEVEAEDYFVFLICDLNTEPPN